MISRRNFLKLAGISTAALGAGYSTGKLINNTKGSYFSVNGFIPADEKILNDLITSFKRKIKSNSSPVIYADGRMQKLITSFNECASAENYSRSGRIFYRINKLNEVFNPDIIISDDKNAIYSPDMDFTLAFAGIRNKMKNKKADYLFYAEYRESRFFSTLFSGKNNLVIENEKGIAEIIKMGKDYKDISVDGPLGKTEINIINGIARVHASCCKNGICKRTGISQSGQIIACAPNKILIHFES